MKKVFITGITGFVGYHLLQEMRKNNVEVWALCRPENKDFEILKSIKGIHTIEGELESISKLPVICNERGFDAFYHLAWSGASGSLRYDYKTQLSNVKWTCDCVEAARQMRCGKIIITGTICEKQCDAIEQQTSFITSSYYLMAKRYANAMVKCIAKQIGIPLIWCRFYHPIGVFNKKEQIMAGTVQKLLKQEEPKFGLAQGLFDVIDVRDLAYALYLMGEKQLIEDTYFVGSNKPKILKAYLEQIRHIVNPGINMHYGAVRTFDLPMKKEWLDVSPLCAETGFMPTYEFEESIREMKKWLKNEREYDSEKWIFE